ncbi:TRAP-type mannitol/chloroaromatic compound transport system, small permease component [Onishia taeanensis]|uniref:TRAP transporter small permease protein n=1 Tax=Onishia taeanensis TaxID=284577 RepID=A0A1G7VIM7_9GAMM|nr:TRAP transporter small permease [Halomonas taeanensis]SDG59411.1 TRAP-type mannitol/chloroaromatic compound transport system, small permease component [Halomonas taeanensis]
MFLTLLRGLCHGIDLIVMLTGKAASYLMPVLAGIVVFEVFARYVLGSPTIWAYDLSLFLFGYITALGGAYAQQKRAHINVDILYLKVSPKAKSVFNLLGYALAVFFLAIIIKVSMGKFFEAIEFDYRRQSEWAPPMYHFWVMMVIACSLFIAQFVRDALNDMFYLATGAPLLKQKEGVHHGH